MGATSAKAMRAEGMDDVIFGGSTARPARNHAEVSLQIDNAERPAPPYASTTPAVLEVVAAHRPGRRLQLSGERGGGAGPATCSCCSPTPRPRDELAGAGAPGPDLRADRRQARPTGGGSWRRRRASPGSTRAGTRRRLRLNAAEANLSRLEDVGARRSRGGLNRLKREARQAERYKRLSAEIRTLQAASLYARWAEAAAALGETEAAAMAAAAAVETGSRDAARARTAALTASEALPTLREEAMVAGAILQRLIIEQDRIDREAADARAEAARHEADIQRIADDRRREAQVLGDASATIDRLTRESRDLDAAIAAAPDRLPELQRAVTSAETARATADRAVEELAAKAAADAARRQAAEAALADVKRTAAAAAARRGEADARSRRAAATLVSARTERGALAATQGDDLGEARRHAALAELAKARTTLEAVEQHRAVAITEEAAVRETARDSEDRLRRLRSEAQGLVDVSKSGGRRPVCVGARPDELRARAGDRRRRRLRR